MKNFRQSFEKIFHQLCLDKEKSAAFFSLFYQNFVDKNPQIKAKFANTDMAAQRDMLRMSFIYLIDFSQTFEETPRLKELAKIHGKMDQNISAQMYDNWLDALILTLEQTVMDLDERSKLAWRVMLSPGIEYMKGSHHLL